VSSNASAFEPAHRRALARGCAAAVLPRRDVRRRRASASSSPAPGAPPGMRRPLASSSRWQRSLRRPVPAPGASSLAALADPCSCAHALCPVCPRALRQERSLARARARPRVRGAHAPRVLPPVGWPALPLVSAARSPACVHARADSAVRPAAPACRGSALASSCWTAPARP
jgi:hypothetical protein